jgi:hypothetical protein
MADLNALIAQGVQFKAPPDPFEQYGKMQQLEQGRQTNQLNVMKLDEARRGFEEANQLRALNPAAADYLAQVSRINPKTGYEFGKLQREAETAKLSQQKTQMELKEAKRKFVQQAQRDTSRNPSDANITAFKEDLLANPDFTDQEKAQLAAGADRLLSMPVAERQAFMASQGASAGELKPTLTPQNLGPTTQVLSTPAFGGTASVVPGSVQQMGMTPGQEQANLIAEARLAQGERRLAGVEARAAEGPKPPALKDVPVHVQKAVMGAAKSITDLDRAIALLEGKGGKEATGLKGYLPNPLLQRMYPEGTEVRAAIADIGSLILHDRSGAAVTAAEYPRQIPFIPSIADDKATALTKLKRMRQIQLDDAEALAGTYTPGQGFKEFKAGGSGGATGDFSGGLSPAEQKELEQLRKSLNKGGK